MSSVIWYSLNTCFCANRLLSTISGKVIREKGFVRISFPEIIPPVPEVILEEGEVQCVACGCTFETAEQEEEEPHCLPCVNKLMLELGINFI